MSVGAESGKHVGDCVTHNNIPVIKSVYFWWLHNKFDESKILAEMYMEKLV